MAKNANRKCFKKVVFEGEKCIFLNFLKKIRNQWCIKMILKCIFNMNYQNTTITFDNVNMVTQPTSEDLMPTGLCINSQF